MQQTMVNIYTTNIKFIVLLLKIYMFTVKEGIGGLGLWRLSVLLVEETWVSGKKPTDLSQVTDNLYHIQYTSPWTEFELTTIVVIDTDCTTTTFHKKKE